MSKNAPSKNIAKLCILTASSDEETINLHELRSHLGFNLPLTLLSFCDILYYWGGVVK
jgi:hypothetical protein